VAVTALFKSLSRAMRRHVVPPLAAWMLVVALAASGVAWVNHNARGELEHRFELRVVIASDFVATHVADLIARERVQALQFLAAPQVDQRTFEQSVAAFGYPAAVLLDGAGRVMHIAPTNQDLVGADLAARYPHMRSALAENRPAVSAVVPSAAAGVPVVSFAVPFESASGRRIFAGAVDIRSSPLGAYLPHAIALAGSHVYLVGDDDTVVGSNQTVSGVTTLHERAPALAAAVDTGDSGNFADEHEDWYFDSAPVAGTPWRLVAAVRGNVLYQPVAETTIGGWITLGGLAVIGLFGVWFWARAARNRSELRESEERFRGLFDGSLVGMALSGADDGRLVRVNPALCDLLGHREPELTALRLRDITHPDDVAALAGALPDALAPLPRAPEPASRQRGFSQELRFVDARGEPKPVAMTATVVRGADGRPRYLAVQAVDVSERYRWEADQRRIRVELTTRAAEFESANDALRAAQQRTTDLIGMLSHDVRQPLGVITGYCEMLLDGWEHLPDAKKRREVARVSRAGTGMMHLVEEVLTLTEIDDGGLRPRPGAIPMDVAVEEAVAGLGGPQVEGIRVDVEPGVAVLADARHVQQILANLLSNARKYGGGQVQVQVGRLDRAQVEICVADAGEGVPEEFVPHLFERFSRARSGVAPTRAGTGLGLYIVQELVTANGGTIRYEPNRPSGSRFVVELPADPARVRELNAAT
jgi:PAS domain S-box-containing protein